MQGKRFSIEDDQIIRAMSSKNEPNYKIADALGRSVKAIEMRKTRLRQAGFTVPKAPRTYSASKARPALPDPVSAQVRFEVPEGVDLSPTGPLMPMPAAQVADPISLVAEQISRYNDREKELLAQLEIVRTERGKIYDRLSYILMGDSEPEDEAGGGDGNA